MSLILVFGPGAEANAQLLHFGAKIGLNLATLYRYDIPYGLSGKQELRPGFVVGAYMTYGVIPFVSIQPEVLYSIKGTKFKETSPTPAEYLFSYNYVEVPVLLKLNLPIGSVTPFKASFYMGPDFAFNVAATQEVTIYPDVPGLLDQSTTFDQKSSTNSFDFNFAVGAGAGYDVG